MARQRDGQGKNTAVPKIPDYANAMMRYCPVLKEESGAPPMPIVTSGRAQPLSWRSRSAACPRK